MKKFIAIAILLSFINVSGFGLVDAFAGVPPPPGGPCSGTECEPGDANADGFVNLADLGVIINIFRGNQTGPGNGDCNMDGFTNLADLGCVITNFRGRTQPPDGNGIGTVSGVLSVGEGNVLDGDTNDPNDPFIDDNNTLGGQVVPLPVTIGGFAGLPSDEFDVYRVNIQTPTTIILSVGDPVQGDLDLLFSDTDGNIIKQSIGTGFFEVIETDPGEVGEFLVVVATFVGQSNYILSLGVSTATSTSVLALTSEPGYLSPYSEFVTNEVIVKFKDRVDETKTRSLISSISKDFGMVQKVTSPSGPILMELTDLEQSNFMLRKQTRIENLPFRYKTKEEEEKARTLQVIKELRRDPEIEYAEPNYISRTTVVPNDEFFNFQWHYPLINLPQAWNITKGSDDVIVAVIDTGVVSNHPDLSSRLVGGFDFITDPSRARDGDGIDPDPFDVGDLGSGTSSSFHGTHGAGTVGATTNNGIGVSGVTWNAKIMPLRVLGQGGGTDFDISQAILYAAGLQNVSGTVPPIPADIINMSLGPRNEDCQQLGPPSTTRANAINSALSAGVIVIVSAGNDNCPVPTPMTTIDGVITVSAVDILKEKAPYSNFGSTVDVAAPGGNTLVDINGDGFVDGVLSTRADDSSSPTTPVYTFFQGTSMAAPHVAGVVALMLSVNPNLTPNDINLLLSSAHPDPNAGPITQDLGNPGRDDFFGHGLIDAFQAVNVARNIAGGGGGTEPPGGTPVLAVSPQSLNFGSTTTSLQLTISNPGTALLTVTSISDDAPWLFVDDTNFPILTVTVNRSGLTDGTFFGNIFITSDGGDKTVPVFMQVQSVAVRGDIGTVFVLVIDPDTLGTIEQAVTNVSSDYAYETPEVPAGSYFVIAGTDRNNDGFICDNAEACGIFPLIDSPALVDVNGDLSNIDFPVSYDFFAAATAQATGFTSETFSGFRRLDF
ncbi:S8 family serine peptidase [Desulfobacterota bacterium AH_259_B03_O07]|nr:S8 family serine peptidase [Desulfobacterota bacterium AH_259_B03_O07]